MPILDLPPTETGDHKPYQRSTQSSLFVSLQSFLDVPYIIMNYVFLQTVFILLKPQNSVINTFVQIVIVIVIVRRIYLERRMLDYFRLYLKRISNDLVICDYYKIIMYSGFFLQKYQIIFIYIFYRYSLNFLL